jgi:hypothetical protein
MLVIIMVEQRVVGVVGLEAAASRGPQFGDLPQRPRKRAVGERPQSIQLRPPPSTASPASGRASAAAASSPA